MGDAAATGGKQLQVLAGRLRAAGSEGKGLRRRMKRSITAAVEPMKKAVQQEIRNIPSAGHEGKSLRAAMVKATKTRIRASGSTALVRLEVAPGLMPKGQDNLPAYMEGQLPRWRHPVFDSSRERWSNESQEPHPYFARTVRPHIIAVRASVVAAVKETTATIRTY